MDKLGALQHADGSFAWWKGMDGNLFLTVWVSEMLTRVSNITGNNGTEAMLKKAYAYMDKQLIKEMKELKLYFKDFKGKHPELFTIGEV